MWPLTSAWNPFTRCFPANTLRRELLGSGSREFSLSVRNTAVRSDRPGWVKSHFTPPSQVRFSSGGRFAVAALSESDSAEGLYEFPADTYTLTGTIGL